MRSLILMVLALVGVCAGGTYYVNGSVDYDADGTESAAELLLGNGTASAGGANTITLQADQASDVDDYYNGFGISIVDGTGEKKSSRLISDYDGTTKVCTVSTNWETPPDNTSIYKITVGADITNDGASQLKGHAWATVHYAQITASGSNTINIHPGTYSEPLNQYLRLYSYLANDVTTIQKDPATTGTVEFATLSLSYAMYLDDGGSKIQNATLILKDFTIAPVTYTEYALLIGGANNTVILDNITIDNQAEDHNASGINCYTAIPSYNIIILKNCNVTATLDAFIIKYYFCGLGGYISAENSIFTVDRDADGAGYGLSVGQEATRIELTPAGTVEIGDDFYIKATNRAGVTSTITYSAAAATVANVTAGLEAAATAARGASTAPWTTLTSDSTATYTYIYEDSGYPVTFEYWTLDGGGANTQTFYSRWGGVDIRLKKCTFQHTGDDIGHAALFGNGSKISVDGCYFLNGNPSASIKCDGGIIKNSLFVSTATEQDDAEKYPATIKGTRNLKVFNNTFVNQANTRNAVYITNNSVPVATPTCKGINVGLEFYSNILSSAGYTLYYDDTASLNLFDYNCYYTTGANLAYMNAGAVETLALMRTGWGTMLATMTGNDAHSINVNPQLNSNYVIGNSQVFSERIGARIKVIDGVIVSIDELTGSSGGTFNGGTFNGN